MAGEMRKILQISRRQIVHAKNRMAVAQQAIGKVRTKKPGSAGDKNMHGQILALQKQWLVESVSASVRSQWSAHSHPHSHRSYAFRGLPSCA